MFPAVSVAIICQRWSIKFSSLNPTHSVGNIGFSFGNMYVLLIYTVCLKKRDEFDKL